MNAAPRTFLMLQGPHGPFFAQLAARLRRAGHIVHCIGFNAGDQFYWQGEGYSAFKGPSHTWRIFLKEFLFRHQITDIVLYGDARSHHAAAIDIGKERDMRLHVFEEGYLRPYWVTYERDGTNGFSPLMDLTIDDMRKALAVWSRHLSEVPATWGELRQHIYYGISYHAYIMLGSASYLGYRSHRNRTIADEFASNLEHLLKLPVKVVRRFLAQRRIKRGDFTYSLVLLQLAHDASVQSHSSFKDMISLIRLSLQDFAFGAPSHMHLVFKAHPLEDYFQPLAEYTFARAEQLGIRDRVHFVEGGKLAKLLDSAHSVVTINSTAAQQALWRGLPVRPLGRAVYNKPSLVSGQDLTEFFKNPDYPIRDDYTVFRRFMLETSQVMGGFYSVRGSARLIRSILPWMLEEQSQYQKIFDNLGQNQSETPILTAKPRLKLVK